TRPTTSVAPAASTPSGCGKARTSSPGLPPRRLVPDNRSDFDRADRRRRHLGGVGDRLVLVLGLDHVEADDLLAAGGGGARRRLGRPVADAHGGGGFRGLDRVAALEHALT